MRYFFLLLIFFFSLNFSVDAQNILFQNEADEDLEKNEETSLAVSLEKFTEKGGTLIRLEKEVQPFTFQPNDAVFPSCSGGNNRSQTVWAILYPYSTQIKLQLPHATRYGFDPYNDKANWSRTKVKPNDEFILWTGFPKSKKLGWEQFSDYLSKDTIDPAELLKMKKFYNEMYYHPIDSLNSRRIYITFLKNAHVHLVRLVETNESLENVYILYFPLEDLIHAPLPEWHTKKSSKKAYEELAKLIYPYFDFSPLE